jgi:hypothetical protein
MSLLCFIQGHAPAADEIWNRGYSFTRCARCECDLIRSDADWEPVPRGHKVVWKSGAHCHSRAPGYARNLPVLRREAGVPALWHGGWMRYLRLLAGGSGGAAAVAAPRLGADHAERPPASYPYLVAIAAIAGAGLQLLFAGPQRRRS